MSFSIGSRSTSHRACPLSTTNKKDPSPTFPHQLCFCIFCALVHNQCSVFFQSRLELTTAVVKLFPEHIAIISMIQQTKYVLVYQSGWFLATSTFEKYCPVSWQYSLLPKTRFQGSMDGIWNYFQTISVSRCFLQVLNFMSEQHIIRLIMCHLVMLNLETLRWLMSQLLEFHRIWYTSKSEACVSSSIQECWHPLVWRSFCPFYSLGIAKSQFWGCKILFLIKQIHCTTQTWMYYWNSSFKSFLRVPST